MPPPVKVYALSGDIPVMQPEKAKDKVFIDSLSGLEPDLIITAAYGQILPGQILDMPAHGCINVHASLLPRYRGAAPINWAIINGDEVTGITLMKMDEGLDTGPVLMKRELRILPEDNAITLAEKLATLASDILPEAVRGVLDGSITPKPQNESGAVYAPLLRKEDGLLDWKLDAPSLNNRIRGLLPWPGCYTILGGRQIKITASRVCEGEGPPGMVVQADRQRLVVGTGGGLLEIMEVQPAGKGVMPIKAFLQGHNVTPGTKLGLSSLDVSK